MLNFQDLPDELILKILSYVSAFSLEVPPFNPIPTGNGLNQPIYSYGDHITQADMNRVKIRRALLSCGQVSKRIRNISRDGTLWHAPPAWVYVCFVRNCNKEVKRIFFFIQQSSYFSNLATAKKYPYTKYIGAWYLCG